MVVSVANYLLGPVALVPIMFTWFALYVFAFFGRKEAMGYMAVMAVAFALVLTDQDVTSPVVRWLLGTVTPVVGGLLLSMVVRLAMDRTEVLEDSEAQTRAIIESAPNAFTTVDEDGVIMEWNREAERTFGYTAEEVVGRQVVDVIILPEDREGHFQRLRAAFATSPDDPPLRGERNLMRKDGTPLFCEVTLSLVEFDDEHILLVFMRDLSHRAEREREREQLFREQAARQEAEHMAEMVQGLQMLLDAALAHGRLEQILELLVPRLCEVLSAEAAAIFLTEEGTGDLVLRASTDGAPDGAGRGPRPARGRAGGRLARAAAGARPARRRPVGPGDAGHGVGDLGAADRGRGRDRRDPGGRAAAARGSTTTTCCCWAWPPTGWRWPSTTRWCSSASTGSRRRSSAACCPTGCRCCRAWRWRPATSRPPARPRWVATGTT